MKIQMIRCYMNILHLLIRFVIKLPNRMHITKKQVAKYYNAKVKPSAIKEGDLVLKNNEVSRVDPNRKLDPN